MTMEREHCASVLRELKTVGGRFPLGEGCLCPITVDYRNQLPDCVHLLSVWRLENPSLSATRFPVSDARTERWLNAAILENELRIMFMIQDPEKQNIGHIGLSGFDFASETVRIDSVLKGVKTACPGIMTRAIESLKTWCRHELQARYVDLVVLEGNDRAIRLYEKCGFETVRLIPLKKIVKNGEINWVEDESLENPELRHVRMQCRL